MPSSQIQWFPGHMAKTRRIIGECLPTVDIVIELRDARIPESSGNPELVKLASGKPVLTVFSKSDLADPAMNAKWADYFEKKGRKSLFIDSISGKNMNKVGDAVREVLADKIKKYESRGMSSRNLKAMVVGIPNVGKSSFINRLAGSKKAKVENRPGVTLAKQWVMTNQGLELLDMPGVLWPKFDDVSVGENLAITKAIKDEILDCERIAFALVSRLRTIYPKLLSDRYGLGSPDTYAELEDWEVLELIGKKRGFLVSGGEINLERAAATVLQEYRLGKLGRITLETPNEHSRIRS
ncbi:MAG: ribosome biogenesis GTPase YlqF [Clostridia bacterium]|nr:ribosome biogenesis GTPase YlqF [Clostridia bacterium]